MRGRHLMGHVAEAAVAAGAKGIRVESTSDVRDVRAVVNVPIIGLIKRVSAHTPVIITQTLEDIAALVAAGADIIALDATFRSRLDGTSGPEFVALVKQEFDIPLLADVDSFESGMAATEAGADSIATTLAGYTQGSVPVGPDFELLHRLTMESSVPVIAEGRFRSPELAKEATSLGAWAVCVGSAITDPWTLTKWFVDAINE